MNAASREDMAEQHTECTTRRCLPHHHIRPKVQGRCSRGANVVLSTITIALLHGRGRTAAISQTHEPGLEAFLLITTAALVIPASGYVARQPGPLPRHNQLCTIRTKAG
jgi:hypothetical protein